MGSVVCSPAIRARCFSLDKICSIHLKQVRFMKTQQSQLNVILIFATAVTALFVAGCAEMGSGNTTSLLTAAGFRARTPQTPQQQQIYAALPPYQVHRAIVKGRTFYNRNTRTRHLDFSARWIHDFDVSKRVEGDGFNFSASLKF